MLADPPMARPIQTLHPKFRKDGAFRQDLQVRVDQYFENTQQSRRDLPAMFGKTAVIFAWFALSWAGLVFGNPPWPLAILLAISLGLAMGAIGMSVMHDANHSGYSRFAWVNRALGWSLDFLGCSSYIWRVKHNQIHHTWTNLDGVDDDLQVGPLARLAPTQPWHAWHRGQQWYAWLLYALLLPKWLLIDDWYNLATRRVGSTPFPLPKPRAWIALVAGKLCYVTWALVIPLMLHPVLPTLGLWLLASGVTGLVLSTTFQLAHCVGNVDFPPPGEAFQHDFAEHQLATTADFARDNRAVNWLMGGLNFQVVHHLFPKVCHLHYRAISQILAETAADHGVQYRVHGSLSDAILVHFRWLKRMGKPVLSADQTLSTHAADLSTAG